MTNHEYVKQCATRALQDLLAGRVPSRADLSPLTGEIKACIDALQEALHIDGAPTVQKAFKALVVDRDWLGKLTAAQPVPRTPDYNLSHLYQALLTGEAAPSAPLDSYGPFGDWQDIATEMYAAWADRGPTGLKNYIRAFNNLRQKGDLETRLIRLLSGEAPAAGKDEPKPERRIRFLPTKAFLERPAQQWLIPGILPRDGVALVYGLSGTYKSFLVMAWSLSIATGTAWLGRKVARGNVAYIAAEGSYGIGKRIKAWLAHHQRSFTDVDDVAVSWFDETLAMQDPSNLAELLTALEEDFTEPPVLVVVDTLSRCSAGADENSNSEMAQVIASADIIRQKFHCTILIVHHAGKDTQRGPRGASALFGNTETLISVSPTATGSKMESIKPKDAPKFDPIYLLPEVVTFGPLDDDSSLVLIQGRKEYAEIAKPQRPAAQSVVLACLEGKQLSYADLMQACMDAGQKENTFKATFKVLREAQILVKVGKLWQVNQSVPASQAPDEPEQEEME